MSKTALVTFVGASEYEKNIYAQELRDWLLEHSNITVRLAPDSTQEQDFGSALVIVLGTTAVSTLAKGISAWLTRNSGARINIKATNGQLIAENLDSKDIAKIVQALSSVQGDQ